MTMPETNPAGTKPRRLLASLALGLFTTAGLPSAAIAQNYNSEGWTILQPAQDTRFVFVSSTTGDDRNSGRSPAQAVRTIARAKTAMRDGKPDWMLLKRGDTWNESFGVWNLSGRSADERVVIASYGESNERPKLLLTDEGAITSPYQQDVSHVAIVGIHMEVDRPTGSSSRGIRWLSTGEDLLIEDCFVAGFKDNVTIEGQIEGFEFATIRRNIIVDAWSKNGHSQGLFITDTNGILIEQNLFDHNGWNPDVQGADPTVFNQNVYIQTRTSGVIFKQNISSRAAGAGAQLRNGGIADSNLFFANPMGLRFGYESNSGTNYGTAQGVIARNVILGGPLAISQGTGFGIWIEHLNGVQVQDNLVADLSQGSNAWALSFHGSARDSIVERNVVHGWNGSSDGTAVRYADNSESIIFSRNIFSLTNPNSMSVRIGNETNIFFDSNIYKGILVDDRSFKVGASQFSQPEWALLPNVSSDRITIDSFVDDNRNLRSYAQTLGFADESEFLEAARHLSRRNWNPELTAAAATEWIRAGFVLSPN